MVSRGHPFRKWLQESIGYLCHHEVTSNEIQIHFFSHGKTGYVNAVSRLTIVYTYAPYYLPGERYREVNDTRRSQSFTLLHLFFPYPAICDSERLAI